MTFRNGRVVIMGRVVEGITTEIDQLRVRETSPGLVELALSLAASVDSATAPTGKSMAAKELRVVMAELHKLAPRAQEGDVVDEIAGQRAKRRADARTQHGA